MPGARPLSPTNDRNNRLSAKDVRTMLLSIKTVAVTALRTLALNNDVSPIQTEENAFVRYGVKGSVVVVAVVVGDECGWWVCIG
jgi:hypothetical protein